MKSLISVAFGAAALATTAIGFATPAAARSDVGVYVGPGGLGVSVDSRRGCGDYWYRREHPYRCGYGRYEQRYYYDNDDWRFRRHHHRDWDRDRDHRWRDRDHRW